jgi:integrase
VIACSAPTSEGCSTTALCAIGSTRRSRPARAPGKKDDLIVFHELRHTFGTLGAAIWPLHDLQGYMGHADIQMTMIYVHHVPKVAAATNSAGP